MNISDVKTKEDISKYHDSHFIQFMMARGYTKEEAKKMLKDTKN